MQGGNEIEPRLVAIAPGESAPGPLDAGELRSIERLIASLERDDPDPFALPRRERAEHGDAPSPGVLQSWAMQPLPGVPATRGGGGFLAWLFLSLGLMAFMCGAVMLGWSLAAGRGELWDFGLPITMGGQAAIIFGLVGLAEAASGREKLFAAALEEHRQRLLMMQNLAIGQAGSTHRRAA